MKADSYNKFHNEVDRKANQVNPHGSKMKADRPGQALRKHRARRKILNRIARDSKRGQR